MGRIMTTIPQVSIPACRWKFFFSVLVLCVTMGYLSQKMLLRSARPDNILSKEQAEATIKSSGPKVRLVASMTGRLSPSPPPSSPPPPPAAAAAPSQPGRDGDPPASDRPRLLKPVRHLSSGVGVDRHEESGQSSGPSSTPAESSRSRSASSRSHLASSTLQPGTSPSLELATVASSIPPRSAPQKSPPPPPQHQDEARTYPPLPRGKASSEDKLRALPPSKGSSMKSSDASQKASSTHREQGSMVQSQSVSQFINPRPKDEGKHSSKASNSKASAEQRVPATEHRKHGSAPASGSAAFEAFKSSSRLSTSFLKVHPGRQKAEPSDLTGWRKGEMKFRISTPDNVRNLSGIFFANIPPPDIRFQRKDEMRVLVLAYMRSGSSLMGEMFQLHPEVFYVFEPLYSFERFHDLWFLNGTRRLLNDTRIDFESVKTQLLRSWFRCDLYNVDVTSLIHDFVKRGKKSGLYVSCLQRFRVARTRSVAALRFCLPLLIKPCLESRVKVVKTIRTHVTTLGALLSRDPNFRVVYLVRDPRPIVLSRIRAEPQNFSPDRVDKQSRDLCQLMLQDVSNYTLLHQSYPSQAKLVRYEDLANKPMVYLRKLYGFARIPLSSTEHDAFGEMTSPSTSVNETLFGTQRSNSTFTALSWRLRSDSFQLIRRTQASCGAAMGILGYRQFSSERERKNLSVPALSDVTVV